MTAEYVFVEANDIRFACLSEGTGPLVLLLHGFPDTARTWDAVRPAIAERGFRAVSPFMRGYDPTQIPSKDADQDAIGRDVVGLIEALGEKDAIVVGHDWGASAAYGGAALAPERVKKLVTIAIPHLASIAPSPKIAWAMRHFVAFKMPGAAARFAKDDFAAIEKIYKRWSPSWSPSAEEFTAVRACFRNRQSLEAALGYYRAFSPTIPGYLKQPLTVPTISFSGDDDPIMTFEDFERAKKMYAGSYEIERMPGGHFMHREHPEIFRERLLAHLGSPF